MSRDPNTEGGRYREWFDPTDALGINNLWVGDVLRLAESPDAVDRVRAVLLMDRLAHSLELPDTVWVVYGTYPSGWSPHASVLSSHVAEADARRWLSAFVESWKVKGRDDFAIACGRLDEVRTLVAPGTVLAAPHTLRRPEADPIRCMW